MKKDQYIEVLNRYIPNQCSEWATDFITKHQVHLKVSKPRQTKLGDYRSPFKDKGHRISINSNLNQYAFFITLLHEFAHLVTWNDFKRGVSPHGKEWKSNFAQLLKPFVEEGVFPEDVKNALDNYLVNPAASSCTDTNLMKTLDLYNKNSDSIYLETLPHGSIFRMPNGMVLQKGDKLRKFYKCILVDNHKQYRVNGLAKVHPLSN